MKALGRVMESVGGPLAMYGVLTVTRALESPCTYHRPISTQPFTDRMSTFLCRTFLDLFLSLESLVVFTAFAYLAVRILVALVHISY